jgi:4'-phosphopantetheinyl transferase
MPMPAPRADAAAPWDGARERIGPCDVHVWRLHVPDAADPDRLRPLLNDDEIRRADGIPFPHLRDRYVAIRGALRIVLSRYGDGQPERVGFTYGEYGKPRLAAGTHSPPLEFNLSHSGDLALVAVTRIGEVGVDIEMHRDVAYDSLAARFFSGDERSALAAMSDEERRGAFFELWTKKEAYAKGRGRGLTLPLDRFTVSLGADGPGLVEDRDDPGAPATWEIRRIPVGSRHAAAVAVAGSIDRVRLRAFG